MGRSASPSLRLAVVSASMALGMIACSGGHSTRGTDGQERTSKPLPTLATLPPLPTPSNNPNAPHLKIPDHGKPMHFPAVLRHLRQAVYPKCTEAPLPGSVLLTWDSTNCGAIIFDGPGHQITVLVGSEPGHLADKILLYNRVNHPIQVVRLPIRGHRAYFVRMAAPEVVIGFRGIHRQVTYDLATGRFVA